MRAVILAGGFAKRLWPLTLHVPKALLPIAGKPAIEYQMEQLISVNDVDQIIISTNKYFASSFFNWWSRLPLNMKEITTILVEPSNHENEKLGSVRGLKYVVDKLGSADSDWIVLAGDNIFGFRMNDFVRFHKHTNSTSVAFYEIEDAKNTSSEFGFGILDEECKIEGFEEKPKQPISRHISTGCYIFSASIGLYLEEYISQNGRHDQMGDFISWLSKQYDVYGFVFNESWFDIGSYGAYEEANKYYMSRSLSFA